MTKTNLDIPVIVVNGSVAQVGVGTMDAGAVQIARDLLSGYSGQYLFYQESSTEYILALTEGLHMESDAYVFDSCDWYDIKVTYSSHTVAVQESGSASGSASGGYAGYPSAGQYSGSYSGNYSGSFSLQAADPPVYQVQLYHDDDGVTVVNPSHYLLFGSLDGMPSLIEGGVKHAYLTNLLLCGCICFVLISRIFRHVF